MSASLAQLIPELREYAKALVDVAGQNGLQPRITSTRRSSAQQAKLYRAFQQGTNPYPVAPPGTSAHEFGYAFDMVVSDMEYLPALGDLWKSWGGVWGGEFNDPIHFEYPGFKNRAAETVANPVVAAAKAIDALPWYISMLMPIALTTVPDSSSSHKRMEQWAADVLTWIRNHT